MKSSVPRKQQNSSTQYIIFAMPKQRNKNSLNRKNKNSNTKIHHKKINNEETSNKINKYPKTCLN